MNSTKILLKSLDIYLTKDKTQITWLSATLTITLDILCAFNQHN